MSTPIRCSFFQVSPIARIFCLSTIEPMKKYVNTIRKLLCSMSRSHGVLCQMEHSSALVSIIRLVMMPSARLSLGTTTVGYSTSTPIPSRTTPCPCLLSRFAISGNSICISRLSRRIWNGSAVVLPFWLNSACAFLKILWAEKRISTSARLPWTLPTSISFHGLIGNQNFMMKILRFLPIPYPYSESWKHI